MVLSFINQIKQYIRKPEHCRPQLTLREPERKRLCSAVLASAVFGMALAAPFSSSAASPMSAAPGAGTRLAKVLAAPAPSVLHLAVEESQLVSPGEDGAVLGTYETVRCTDEDEAAAAQALRRMGSRIRRRMEADAGEGASDLSSALLMRRADTNALSFLETCALTSEDGTPSERWYGHNYDPVTGSAYALDDVILDTRLLAQQIVDALETAYLQGGDADELIPSVRRLIYRDELAWTIDYDGISFWIPAEYLDLAETAGPLLHVKLAYHEDEGLISEKLKFLPDSYIAALSPDERFTMTGEDDDAHLLSLQEWRNASTKQRIMTVGLDNRTAIADLTYWSYRPYVMHSDGKNYLYLDTAEEDLRLMQVYDLNVASLESPETLLCGFSEGDALPTDPARFSVEKKCDLLGSYRICRNYCVGDDGLTALDSSYRIDGETIRLRLKRDIPAEEVVRDGDGSRLRTRPLPEGTELVLRATDGESTVDLYEELTGRTYRFTVEPGVPQLIQGVSVTDLFDFL